MGCKIESFHFQDRCLQVPSTCRSKSAGAFAPVAPVPTEGLNKGMYGFLFTQIKNAPISAICLLCSTE